MLQGDVFRITYKGVSLNQPYSNVFDFRLKDVPFIGSGADPDDVTDEAIITALAENFAAAFYGELAGYLSNWWGITSWDAFFMFEPTIGLAGDLPGGGIIGAVATDALPSRSTWYIRSPRKVRTRGGGLKYMSGLHEGVQNDGLLDTTFVTSVTDDVLGNLNNGFNVGETGFYLFEFESVITHMVKEVNDAGEVKKYRLPVSVLEWTGYVADNWSVPRRIGDLERRAQ